MATLNGAEFEIIEIEWSTYQNNIIQEILGSDTVQVQHQGYGSEPVRIKGMVHNERELDLFKEQFYSGPVIILITDPNSHKEYQVYALGTVKTDSVSNRTTGTGIIFDCLVQLRYPYADSTFEINQTKRITTRNQEWSQDDSGKYIKVDGSADSLTDIKVTGRKAGAELDTNPVGEPSFETIAGWTYAELDTNAKMLGERTNSWKYHGDYSYRIQAWIGAAADDYGKISRSVDFTNIDMFSFICNIATSGGVEGTVYVSVDGDLLKTFSDVNDVERLYVDTRDYTGSLTLEFKYVVTTSAAVVNTYFDDIVSYAHYTENLSVYNMADPTVKCAIANRILDTAVHTINSDGSGSVEYEDTFLTKKYLAATVGSGGTWYTGELGVTGVGQVTWFFDTKYPISEIPVFPARVFKFLGIPTIQISLDDITWYDIKTAIVNDVTTDYDLEADDLDLRGETSFYVRVRAESGVICIIKNIAIYIAMHTIYAKNIKLTRGSAVNTFKCVQDSEGEDLFDIEFIFKSRWWV